MTTSYQAFGSASVNTNTWQLGTTGTSVGKLVAESNHDGGFSRTYTYDSTSGLRTSSTTAIDVSGGSPTLSRNLSYDAVGRIASTTYTGGFVVLTEYNPQGYLSVYRDANNNNEVLRQILAIDAYGNITSEMMAAPLTSSERDGSQFFLLMD